jgi:hypothetical protein
LLGGEAVRSVAAIVAPETSEAEQARREISKLNTALADAERAHDSASQVRLKRLLALGERLVLERSRHPRKGPKARSWGELLHDCGIDGPRAWEAMKYAGYVEKVSSDSEDTPTALPDLREAGIDKKPRKSDVDASGDDSEPSAAASDWDIAQMKVCERVKSFAMKLPDDKRGDLAFSLRQLADTIEEMSTWTK